VGVVVHLTLAPSGAEQLLFCDEKRSNTFGAISNDHLSTDRARAEATQGLRLFAKHPTSVVATERSAEPAASAGWE